MIDIKKFGCFVIAFFIPLSATAGIVWIGWNAPPRVGIQVGDPVSVTNVIHTVPAGSVGDGTPIAGAPADVFIGAYGTTPGFFRTFNITVDSSVPLTNGTDIIPFTDISWTSASGDIPAGTFAGTTGQVILNPTWAVLLVYDYHTFFYNNVNVQPAGTYTGTVTYTVSFP
jgi:hypothetical protein